MWQLTAAYVIPLALSTVGFIRTKSHDSSKVLNFRPAVYTLMQKAVRLITFPVVRQLLAERRIRSAWWVRPVLFWEPAALLWWWWWWWWWDDDDNNNINNAVLLRALHFSPSSSSSSLSPKFLSRGRWRPQRSNIYKNIYCCLSSHPPLWTVNTPTGYGAAQLHFVIEERLQKSERRSYVQKGASVTECSEFNQQKVCATLYKKLNN